MKYETLLHINPHSQKTSATMYTDGKLLNQTSLKAQFA